MATLQTAPVVQTTQTPTAPAQAATTAPQRYLALDAYRGFIMFILVSGGFGLAALARVRPEFTWIAGQFDHKPWEWIAFWDLIQPAFMFMVGVALPWSLASRVARPLHVRATPTRGYGRRVTTSSGDCRRVLLT